MRLLIVAAALGACSFNGGQSTSDGGELDAAAIDAALDAASPRGSCAASGVVRDTFDAASRNAYWISVGDAGINLDGDTATFTSSGFIASEFVGFIGRRWFNFTSSETSIEVVARPINGAESLFKVELDLERSFGFRITNAGIIPYVVALDRTFVQGAPVPFDSGLHRFLRIREDAGVVHFEARGSAGAEWSELFSAASPAYITAVRPVLGIVSLAIPSVGTATFDEFNADVIESDWCSVDGLDGFSGDAATFDWVPVVSDLEGVADCQINAAFDQGTVEVSHNVGSSNCIAASESRQLYELDDGSGVAVNFTRQKLGSATRGFLELTALQGADPRIFIEITDNQLCARAQTSGAVIPAQCTGLIAQSRIGIRREGGAIVFAAGDKSSTADFATMTIDASMPVKVGVGAESFGISSNPAGVVMVFSSFSVDAF